MSAITASSGSNVTTTPDRGTVQASGKTAVGLTEVSIKAITAARKAFVLRADPANTGKIYIGPTGVSTTTGFLLQAGDTLVMADYTGAVIAISDTAAQNVFWWEVTT